MKSEKKYNEIIYRLWNKVDCASHLISHFNKSRKLVTIVTFFISKVNQSLLTVYLDLILLIF